MKGSIVIRIYVSTFNRILKEFPPKKEEKKRGGMISYFERLSKSLQELNEDVRRVEE